MSMRLRLLLVIEALLLCLTLFGVSRDTWLRLLLVIGCVMIITGSKWLPKHVGRLVVVIGIITLVISLFSQIWFIAAIVLCIGAVVFMRQELLAIWTWGAQHKHFHSVAIQPVDVGKYKQTLVQNWLGRAPRQQAVQDEDEVVINAFFGDTVIDLGTTYMAPDQVVAINKAFGDTRVIVPLGVGVMITHSTILGDVIFEKERVSLKNQTVRRYSQDYEKATQRVRIVSHGIVGHIEVIRL